MPLPDGERIATLEADVRNVSADVRALESDVAVFAAKLREVERTVDEWHSEQRVMHRENGRRLRRQTLAIQTGGLVLGLCMLILAAATYFGQG